MPQVIILFLCQPEDDSGRIYMPAFVPQHLIAQIYRIVQRPLPSTLRRQRIEGDGALS